MSSESDDSDRRASLAFSAQLRGARTAPSGGNEFTQALAAHAHAQAYGTEAEIAEARGRVESLVRDAAPAPDFGAGARPRSAAPLGMNDVLRRARNPWAITGRGVR